MGLFSRKTKVTAEQMGTIAFRAALEIAGQVEEMSADGEVATSKARFESVIFHMVAMDMILRRGLSEHTYAAVRVHFIDAADALEAIWRVRRLKTRIRERFDEYGRLVAAVEDPEDFQRIGNAAARNMTGEADPILGATCTTSFMQTLKHFTKLPDEYAITDA